MATIGELLSQYEQLFGSYSKVATGRGHGALDQTISVVLDEAIGGTTTVQAKCLTPCPPSAVVVFQAEDGQWYAVSPNAPTPQREDVVQNVRRRASETALGSFLFLYRTTGGSTYAGGKFPARAISPQGSVSVGSSHQFSRARYIQTFVRDDDLYFNDSGRISKMPLEGIPLGFPAGYGIWILPSTIYQLFGQCFSCLVYQGTRQISNGTYSFEPSYGTFVSSYKEHAAVDTWILPQKKIPCSYTQTGLEEKDITGTTTSIDFKTNLDWSQVLLIDSTSSRALVTNSKSTTTGNLFSRSDSFSTRTFLQTPDGTVDLNQSASFSTTCYQRTLPRVGEMEILATVYYYSRRASGVNINARSNPNNVIWRMTWEAPEASIQPGTPIVLSTLLDRDGTQCIQGFGTVSGAVPETDGLQTSGNGNERGVSIYRKIIVQIDSVVECSYDSNASLAGSLYSNNGSVVGLMDAIGYGRGFYDPAYIHGSVGRPTGPFRAVGIQNGVSWVGDKFYIANSTQVLSEDGKYLNSPRMNYAEEWSAVMENGKMSFYKKRRPHVARQYPLATGGQKVVAGYRELSGVVGNYLP